MYKLTDVKKDYPKGRGTVHALRGVNLEIADAEWLSIQGPTGHGKSTLLQILGGLDRATSGSVELDGRELTRLGEGAMTEVRAQFIGFIFQTFNLIPTLTAQENVETALVPLGVSGESRKARAAEALASVGLADRARRCGAGNPAGTRAASTFSCALSVGIRLNVWKTNPIDVARTVVTWLSRMLARSWPSKSTRPAVGRSSPPSICSSVLLPWPVGPWMESHSPSSMTRSIPRSAATVPRSFR